MDPRKLYFLKTNLLFLLGLEMSRYCLGYIVQTRSINSHKKKKGEFI